MSQEQIQSTSVNRNTEIRKLGNNQLIGLSKILEENVSAHTPAWKLLMSSILNDNNEPKYNNNHIRTIENYSKRDGKLCAEILFDEWGTSGRNRPTVQILLNLLIELDLKRAAEYVYLNILGEPPTYNQMTTDQALRFPYEKIAEYCYWNDSNKVIILGAGSFGTVYLADIPQLNKVAVKRLQNTEDNYELKKRNFQTEIITLSKYKHENLIELLGYAYNDEDVYCLIYEYMCNGTLQSWLAHKDKLTEESKRPLTWQERIIIAKDVSAALTYLHRENFVHRDVKSANILLDGNLRAKLGDFGLAHKSNEDEDNSVSSTAGTSVYMSPEAFNGDISCSGDTYSFGVVLLELLTGLPPFDETRQYHDIITYVQNELEEDESITRLLDITSGDWAGNSLIIDTIAKQCLQERSYERPPMYKIFEELNKISLS